ncbi:hypothetical protein C8F04DRAFT_1267510 [Mycena alexandri]|uniref:Uncharacterized protein n=1 Tax=Mycena alexandri TaxID=1745969 RepID=A0AAD6SHA7_9AGAR|nr:hypothetical protein C8F04DRAFT_1267510 [Mycena alexandri]
MRDGPLTPLTSDPIPTDFIPCVIPDHLGPNFTNHIDFTRHSKKRYWILYAPADVAGLYSLKQTAYNVAGDFRCTEEAFAWFNGWRETWAAWVRHCYERHEKCAVHPHACASGGCPTHPQPQNPEAIVLPDVKQEPPVSVIKREASSVAGGIATGPGTSRVFARKTGRSKAAALESDSDDNAGGYRAPLYDPDTPPEKSKTRQAPSSASVQSVTPEPPVSAAPTVMSATVTSVSSLSESVASDTQASSSRKPPVNASRCASRAPPATAAL